MFAFFENNFFSMILEYKIIIKINKMSKLRTKLATMKSPLSHSRIASLLSASKHKASTGNDKLNLTRVFQQTRCKTITSDQSQMRKDSLFNKNIAHFRQSFHDKDSNLLPFLASLRSMKDYRKIELPKNVSPVAFNAERQTANQKIKKDVKDIRANPFRVSKVFYRWHKKSGKGIRDVCQFECSLRMDNKSMSLKNPQESTFNNTIAPIRLKTIEPEPYKPSELICERQKRLFTLRGE